MTQAFNLSQLANKVNTSGQLDVSTGASGTLPVANGGTGTASPTLVGGTNITISGSWPNQTVTAAGGSPTTAQVLSALTGMTADAVGSITSCPFIGSGSISVNGTTAGSNLRTYNPGTGGIISPGFSGTWRNLGAIVMTTSNWSSAVWIRIS